MPVCGKTTNYLHHVAIGFPQSQQGLDMGSEQTNP
jgi:hypothetical protein